MRNLGVSNIALFISVAASGCVSVAEVNSGFVEIAAFRQREDFTGEPLNASPALPIGRSLRKIARCALTSLSAPIASKEEGTAMIAKYALLLSVVFGSGSTPPDLGGAGIGGMAPPAKHFSAQGIVPRVVAQSAAQNDVKGAVKKGQGKTWLNPQPEPPLPAHHGTVGKTWLNPQPEPPKPPAPEPRQTPSMMQH